MKSNRLLHNTVLHPLFPLISIAAILLILPRFGSAATMVGCALVLTAYVAGIPDRFRGHNGSMTLAACLVVFMWVLAALVVVLSLAGEIQWVGKESP